MEKKFVAVLVSQIDDENVAWYAQYEQIRDVPDFALWFCIWNTVKGKTGLELYNLPNGELDRYVAEPGIDQETEYARAKQRKFHRDQLVKYKVWSKPLDPVKGGERKQVQVQIDAFGELFAEFVKRQPADHYGIKTTGHGGPNNLFGEIFEFDYGKPVFKKIREALGGKNLAFFDAMTNCNMGSYFILEAMATAVDYYLASALDVGGIGNTKGGDRESTQRMYKAGFLRAEYNYNKAFENKPDRNIKGSLINLALMQQSYWAKCAELKDDNDMISKHIMQEVAIYDCSMVAALRQELGWNADRDLSYLRRIVTPLPTNKNCFVEYRNKYVDMHSYVLEHKPTAKDALDKVMVYYTSNEQFGVNWPINNEGTLAKTTSHGMLMHLASWLGI